MPPKDTWNRDYGYLVELGAQIGIQIRKRDEESDKKLNPRLNKQLQDYQKKLQALKMLVRQQSRDYSFPNDDIAQRESMINELSRKYDHLRKCFNRGWSTETRYKSTDSEPWNEDGAGVGKSKERIQVEQQQIIDEQDEGLEQLSKALRNQRKMGLDMQDNIQEQNTMIDDIQEHTTKTDGKIKIQTRRVAEVRQKYSCQCTCVLWTTVILLAIAIIVVGAVPFK